MKIVIDGQELPLQLRMSRDLLLLAKALSRHLGWGIRYDAISQTILINSQSSAKPGLLPEVNTVEKQSNRLLGKKICLDPGHGGADVGVMGPAGTTEKELTLAVALLLKQKLEAHGAQVVLTREKDRPVLTDEATDSLSEWAARVDIAQDNDSDLFISLHLDSFSDASVSGTTTFHYGSPASQKLAHSIQSSLVRLLGTKDRLARYASFYVIRNTRLPSILIHLAFISNPEDELLLSGSDGQEAAAQGIFEGLMQYYKV